MHIEKFNQPTFKWNKTTHLNMTLLALRDSGLSPSDVRQLARFSQMPDFIKEELGRCNNAHFYFPTKKKPGYFLGASGQNNALSRYLSHISKALNSVDKETFYRYVGYAMHYIQDVSMPMHTEAGSIIQKIRDYYLHSNFEQGEKYGATPRLKELEEGYKPEKLSFTSLSELFRSTALFSSDPRFKVSRFNKKKWKHIQQECFNRGVNATAALFDGMRKLVNI